MAIATKTYTAMSSDDLDKLLKETFDLDYCFVADELAENGASYKVNVTEKDVEEARGLGNPKTWDKWDISKYRLLAALVAEGKLEKGDFLIEVNW